MKAIPLFVVFLLFAGATHGQRGNIIIPVGDTVSIPVDAQICADTIFANNPGFGTLNLANASCVCPGSVILPVELVSLSASRIGDGILLEWTTAMETNSYGFEVERSHTLDPDWVPLGFVPGAGTTTSFRTYRFLDRPEGLESPARTLRYRLRMIDLDGSYRYSPEVEVRVGDVPHAFELFQPYPSPATYRLTIPFSLPGEAAVSISLYDLVGAKVRSVSESRLLAAGSHAVTISTSKLPIGLYLVVLQMGNERRTAMVGIVGGK